MTNQGWRWSGECDDLKTMPEAVVDDSSCFHAILVLCFCHYNEHCWGNAHALADFASFYWDKQRDKFVHRTDLAVFRTKITNLNVISCYLRPLVSFNFDIFLALLRQVEDWGPVPTESSPHDSASNCYISLYVSYIVMTMDMSSLPSTSFRGQSLIST